MTECCVQGLSLFKGVEAVAAGFTARCKATVDAHSVQLLGAAAVELQDLEAGGDVPDVAEGDLGELHAPLHGDADAAAEGRDGVAQVLAAVEALVGVGPHAVHGPHPLGFRQHIFESDLQVVVNVVGITVDKIDFGHGCSLHLQRERN